jgi:Tol biopolymer transport system component
VADELVYVTDKRGMEEVWIASLAGKWDRPLVTRAELASNEVEDPVFSPDGRRVGFAADTGRTISIYVTPLDGGTPILASGGAAVAHSPTWSPDGDWLAYYTTAAVDFRLVKAHVGSSDPPLELGLGGAVNAPVPEWSPTGEWIAFRDLDSRLALVSPDGKRRVRLAGDGPVAWARDGKRLYQIRAAEGVLVAIDIPSGQERTLRTGLDPPYAYGNPQLRISLTADSKNIVYTVLKAREEIWLLEGIRAPRPWYARLGRARRAW